jgi:excisionase family DNA binding protein
MGKQRFAQVEVVFDNPPDNRGFFALTIIRRIRIAGSPHKFEREVKPNGLLSSTEAAKLLRVSVRHLYRLVEEGHLKREKQRKHLWFVSRDVQRFAMKRARLSGRREAFLIN